MAVDQSEVELAKAEIEAEFGSPSDYEDEEFIDMTHWVKYGSQISQSGLIVL